MENINEQLEKKLKYDEAKIKCDIQKLVSLSKGMNLQAIGKGISALPKLFSESEFRFIKSGLSLIILDDIHYFLKIQNDLKSINIDEYVNHYYRAYRYLTHSRGYNNTEELKNKRSIIDNKYRDLLDNFHFLRTCVVHGVSESLKNINDTDDIYVVELGYLQRIGVNESYVENTLIYNICYYSDVHSKEIKYREFDLIQMGKEFSKYLDALSNLEDVSFSKEYDYVLKKKLSLNIRMEFNAKKIFNILQKSFDKRSVVPNKKTMHEFWFIASMLDKFNNMDLKEEYDLTCSFIKDLFEKWNSNNKVFDNGLLYEYFKILILNDNNDLDIEDVFLLHAISQRLIFSINNLSLEDAQDYVIYVINHLDFGDIKHFYNIESGEISK